MAQEYVVIITALSKKIVAPLAGKLVLSGCAVRPASNQGNLTNGGEDHDPSCVIAFIVSKGASASGDDVDKTVKECMKEMSAKYYSIVVIGYNCSYIGWSSGNIDMRDVKTYPASKNEEKKDKAN